MVSGESFQHTGVFQDHAAWRENFLAFLENAGVNRNLYGYRENSHFASMPDNVGGMRSARLLGLQVDSPEEKARALRIRVIVRHAVGGGEGQLAHPFYLVTHIHNSSQTAPFTP